jgi:hypothetical protein
MFVDFSHRRVMQKPTFPGWHFSRAFPMRTSRNTWFLEAHLQNRHWSTKNNHNDGNSATLARNGKQRTAMIMPTHYATRGISGALLICAQREAKAIQTIGIAKSHNAMRLRVWRYLEIW